MSAAPTDFKLTRDAALPLLPPYYNVEGEMRAKRQNAETKGLQHALCNQHCIMVGSISVIVGDTRRPLQYMTYAKNLHLLLLGALRCAILLCIMKSEKK